MPQKILGIQKKLKRHVMSIQWVFFLLGTQNQQGRIVGIASHRTDSLINKAQLIFIELNDKIKIAISENKIPKIIISSYIKEIKLES